MNGYMIYELANQRHTDLDEVRHSRTIRYRGYRNSCTGVAASARQRFAFAVQALTNRTRVPAAD